MKKKKEKVHQKIAGDEYKWKHNTPKSIDTIKAVVRRKFI